MTDPAEPYRGVLPHMIVRDAAAAITFYQSVFAAQVLDRSDGPDGRVWHAELGILGGKVLLADEFPEFGMVAPTTLGGSPIALTVYVDDIYDVVERARANGADIPKGIKSKHWGDLYCGVNDPFGHRWSVASRQAELSPEELEEKRADFFRRHPEYTPQRAAAKADEWREHHSGHSRPNAPPRQPAARDGEAGTG